jgi:hypothetical protein
MPRSEGPIRAMLTYRSSVQLTPSGEFDSEHRCRVELNCILISTPARHRPLNFYFKASPAISVRFPHFCIPFLYRFQHRLT